MSGRQSLFAVEAETEADMVATVSFAAEHNLRLVVKGTGHDWWVDGWVRGWVRQVVGGPMRRGSLSRRLLRHTASARCVDPAVD